MASENQAGEADWMQSPDAPSGPPFAVRTDSSDKLWLDKTDESGRLQSLCLGAKREAYQIFADAMVKDGFRGNR